MVIQKVQYVKQKAEELNRYRSWRFAIGLISIGFILFGFVWWPIQAERAYLLQKQWEEKIGQKKNEQHQLQMRYKALTSLKVLDQWAQSNGPWKNPTPHDIITF